MKLALALSVACVATTHALPAFNATAAVPYGAQRTFVVGGERDRQMEATLSRLRRHRAPTLFSDVACHARGVRRAPDLSLLAQGTRRTAARPARPRGKWRGCACACRSASTATSAPRRRPESMGRVCATSPLPASRLQRFAHWGARRPPSARLVRTAPAESAASIARRRRRHPRRGPRHPAGVTI